MPLGVLACMDIDTPEVTFTHAEALILPLGEHDNCVDALLCFANYERKFD